MRRRRSGRSRGDAHAVCRHADRQSEIGRRLQDDDGPLPRRGQGPGAGSPLVRRSVRLRLRGADAAENADRTATSRTTPRFLYDNGFDAIQAAGGFINLLVEGNIEILDRTAIYAPPVPGKENDPLRWNWSMRMLQLPNADSFQPQSWVPRMMANYTTFNIDPIDRRSTTWARCSTPCRTMKDAWKNTLEALGTDPYGAKVNVRDEFIANMGQRITLVTDYDLPITVDSERSLFAIEATNEQSWPRRWKSG